MTSETRTPLVTVVIPSFNHAQYLEQRLTSIFNQRFRDVEIIFLDDASSDNSVEIAQRLAIRHPMKMVLNEQNSGTPFSQWNKGVGLARGELVWIAESDDVAQPDFLTRLVAVLNREPQVGLAYCQSRRIDESGQAGIVEEENLLYLHSTRWQSDFVAPGRDECRHYLARQNTIANASAVVFRKCLYEQVSGADESFRIAGDWDLWSRILLHSDVAFVAEPLNEHRVHATCVRRKTGEVQSLFEKCRILSRIHVDVGVPSPVSKKMAEDLRGKCVFLLRTHCVKWRHIFQVALLVRHIDGLFLPRLLFEWLRQSCTTHPKETPGC